MSYLIVTLLHLSALVVTCILGQYDANTCPGGHTEGAIVRSDPYWYKCSNGRLEPQGCISNTGQQLRIGETVTVNDDYESRCELSGGRLSLKPSACLWGTGYPPQKVRLNSEQDLDGKVWIACSDRGHYALGEIKGCVVNGRRVRLGEKVTQDETEFECQLGSNRDAVLSAQGCARNGRTYPIGQMFEDDKFFYHCSLNSDNTCKGKMIGCIHQGKRYYDRQIYHQGEEMFRCRINGFAGTGEHTLAGCIKQGDVASNFEPVEKIFGCQWEDGTAPLLYLVECVERDGRAVKQRLRCKYAPLTGGYPVDLLPGCFGAVSDRQNAACVKLDEYNGVGLELKLFDATDDYARVQYSLVDDEYTCSIFSARRRNIKRNRR